MTATVLHLAASPWALVVLGLACYVDALVPPVPSEMMLLALAALSVAGMGPPIGLVVLVAALGAFAGDRTAYEVGRRLPAGRLPFVSPARSAVLLGRVGEQLDQRGAMVVLTGRAVPVGRVAVNIGAGMVGFSARRFTVCAAVASLLWAGGTSLLGVAAGAALHAHPVLGVVAGIASGLVVGLALDVGTRLVRRNRAARAGTARRAGFAGERVASPDNLSPAKGPIIG